MNLLVTIEAIVGYLNEAQKSQEYFNLAEKNCDAAAQELLAQWKGDAAEAFRAEQEQFKNWSIDMLKVVQEFFRIVNSIIQKYQEMEDTVRGKIG